MKKHVFEILSFCSFFGAFILLMSPALLTTSCTNTDTQAPQEDSVKESEFEQWHGFNVRVVDSCEYIIRADYTTRGSACWGHGFMAHKGNCKYCAERRKKEQDELKQEIVNEVTKAMKEQSKTWTWQTADHIIHRIYEEDYDGEE